MRFQVPQFIEIEDKIFGPLTFKQFAYVIGGAGISFLLWTFLPKFIAILFIIPVLGLAAAFAFYKVNNKPFVYIVQAAINYFLSSRLYIWKKEKKIKKEAEKEEEEKPADVFVPKISDSKLKDLSWSLDVHKKIS